MTKPNDGASASTKNSDTALISFSRISEASRESAEEQKGSPYLVPAILDTVAEAIETAECPHRQGPFGLFDYSSYEGSDPPHVIRDYRDPGSDTWGTEVFRSDDQVAARKLYDTLTRRHIAQAAINAYLASLSGGRPEGRTAHPASAPLNSHPQHRSVEP